MTISEVYSAVRRWTMVPEAQFRENLRLASEVADVPGNVTECGTWRGGMLAALAAATGRRAVGLDSFRGLPPVDPSVDGPAAVSWQNRVPGSADYHDNCLAHESEVRDAMAAAGVTDYSIHAGWLADTLPRLPVEPIAILRVDVDWFAATSLCLSRLYERVSPGGLVLMDDYAAWDGAAVALHRFLASRGSAERIVMDRQTWVCHFFKR